MLTDKDFRRIHRDNYKNGWGFTREQLLRLVYAHKYGNAHRREYIEERLTDANFHYERGMLMQGKYTEVAREIRRR